VASTAPLPVRPGSIEDLARLRRELEAADRLYNDALTALDGALQRVREMPPPPPPFDDTQIAALTKGWDVLSAAPAMGRGWRRRLRAHVWGMLAPLFERQQAFNNTLVDHLNRNVTMHRETARALAGTLTALREEFERLVHFQSKLILWAQQITLYVDTRDRYVAGLPSGLFAAISSVSDDQQKRWESMAARERRSDLAVDDLRAAVAVLQRAVQTIKRGLERAESSAPPATDAAAATPEALRADATSLDSYKYVGFEDRFRGSPQQIRERLSAYVPYFEGARDVLDVGCGRGEFLELLRERGVPARGIDHNPDMAAICRERGLDATSSDALAYLRSLPDESLGGMFAAQVVEHFEPGYLTHVLEAAYHRLKPGSRIVLETINPACWYAFFSSYIRDITHVRPLHPDTLRYLLLASGFDRVEIRYAAPFPEEYKLQPVALPAAWETGAAADPLPGLTRAFNQNVKTLNDLLFTYLDYAAIGQRPD